jgi:hypothetical protein
MKIRAAMPTGAMLSIALCAATTAQADTWPQSAIANYFNSCVTIHKERWPCVPEPIVTRLCTCKVSKFQAYPWEQFAKTEKEVGSSSLEQFVALPLVQQELVLKDMEASVILVMLLAVGAEEECAPN